MERSPLFGALLGGALGAAVAYWLSTRRGAADASAVEARLTALSAAAASAAAANALAANAPRGVKSYPAVGSPAKQVRVLRCAAGGGADARRGGRAREAHARRRRRDDWRAARAGSPTARSFLFQLPHDHPRAPSAARPPRPRSAASSSRAAPALSAATWWTR